MFAEKTESGTLRQVAFEQWTGIHVPERTRARVARPVHKFSQWFEALAKHLVVVGIAGIAGDKTGELRSAERGVRSVRLPTPDCRSPVRRNALEFGLRALDCVARGQANNALCLGQHLPGIDAFVSVALQVAHFPMLL